MHCNLWLGQRYFLIFTGSPSWLLHSSRTFSFQTFSSFGPYDVTLSEICFYFQMGFSGSETRSPSGSTLSLGSLAFFVVKHHLCKNHFTAIDNICQILCIVSLLLWVIVNILSIYRIWNQGWGHSAAAEHVSSVCESLVSTLSTNRQRGG